MTYLLTGATGFIGRRLTELLLSQGHAVHYLGRRRSTSVDSRAAFQPWPDPVHTVAPVDSVPRCDTVINLAGEPVGQRWTEEAKRRIYESRVAGTRNLVTGIARLQHRPGVLISASAVGYYGDRGDQLLTEDTVPGTGFLADVCRSWEREAERARALDVRVVTIRTGIVLAADGGALSKMLPAFRFGVGGPLGDGKQWMSWIYRDDLVRMFQWAAETPAVFGPVNGTAPEPVTDQAFTKSLAGALHRPAILPIPKFGLKILFGEMASALLDSARAVPTKAEALGFEFLHRRLDAALTAALA